MTLARAIGVPRADQGFSSSTDVERPIEGSRLWSPVDGTRSHLMIDVTAHGFTLSGAGEAWEVAWAQVREVVAFKGDRFIVDDVCLSILVGERWLEVHEEMQGWDELVAGLDSRIMGMTPSSEWRPRVVHPPFSRNEEVIFRRAEL